METHQHQLVFETTNPDEFVQTLCEMQKSATNPKAFCIEVDQKDSPADQKLSLEPAAFLAMAAETNPQWQRHQQQVERSIARRQQLTMVHTRRIRTIWITSTVVVYRIIRVLVSYDASTRTETTTIETHLETTDLPEFISALRQLVETCSTRQLLEYQVEVEDETSGSRMTVDVDSCIQLASAYKPEWAHAFQQAYSNRKKPVVESQVQAVKQTDVQSVQREDMDQMNRQKQVSVLKTFWNSLSVHYRLVRVVRDVREEVEQTPEGEVVTTSISESEQVEFETTDLTALHARAVKDISSNSLEDCDDLHVDIRSQKRAVIVRLVLYVKIAQDEKKLTGVPANLLLRASWSHVTYTRIITIYWTSTTTVYRILRAGKLKGKQKREKYTTKDPQELLQQLLTLMKEDSKTEYNVGLGLEGQEELLVDAHAYTMLVQDHARKETPSTEQQQGAFTLVTAADQTTLRFRVVRLKFRGERNTMGEETLLETADKEQLVNYLQKLSPSDNRHCRVVVLGLPRYVIGFHFHVHIFITLWINYTRTSTVAYGNLTDQRQMTRRDLFKILTTFWTSADRPVCYKIVRISTTQSDQSEAPQEIVFETSEYRLMIDRMYEMMKSQDTDYSITIGWVGETDETCLDWNQYLQLSTIFVVFTSYVSTRFTTKWKIVYYVRRDGSSEEITEVVQFETSDMGQLHSTMRDLKKQKTEEELQNFTMVADVNVQMQGGVMTVSMKFSWDICDDMLKLSYYKPPPLVAPRSSVEESALTEVVQEEVFSEVVEEQVFAVEEPAVEEENLSAVLAELPDTDEPIEAPTEGQKKVLEEVLQVMEKGKVKHYEVKRFTEHCGRTLIISDSRKVYPETKGYWKCDVCAANTNTTKRHKYETYHCFECDTYDVCIACFKKLKEARSKAIASHWVKKPIFKRPMGFGAKPAASGFGAAAAAAKPAASTSLAGAATKASATRTSSSSSSDVPSYMKSTSSSLSHRSADDKKPATPTHSTTSATSASAPPATKRTHSTSGRSPVVKMTKKALAMAEATQAHAAAAAAGDSPPSAKASKPSSTTTPRSTSSSAAPKTPSTTPKTSATTPKSTPKRTPSTSSASKKGQGNK